MIVSRFTSFTKNFVICYQVTKIFCSKYGCASAFSSAKSSCHLGPHACVAISVLREVAKNTVLARYHFSSRPLKLNHEKNSRVRPCELEHFHPLDSAYILLAILADHATGFLRTVSLSSFLFMFSVSAGSSDGSLRTVLLILSPRVDAGCNVGTMGTTVSCGSDVGDVGVRLSEKSRSPNRVLCSPCCTVSVCRI